MKRPGFSVIFGDYHDTLTGMYDLIIHDAAPDEPDETELNAHLSPGGLLVTFD